MVEELSSKANPAENESCLERQERMVLLLVLYIFQTIFFSYYKVTHGTSLMVQWLRSCAPNTGGTGLMPGPRTRSHMPQLRPGANKLKKKKAT